jgi:hypothetical protein
MKSRSFTHGLFNQLHVIFFVSLLALSSCSRFIAKPAASTNDEKTGEIAYLGPLVYTGPGEDRVSAGSGAIHADGEKDGVFRIRIAGHVEAFALVASRPNGEVYSNQDCWDTIRPDQSYPASFTQVHKNGENTWVLGIFNEKGDALNAQKGFKPMKFYGEYIYIHAADPGFGRFQPGRSFALLVLRANGQADRSTTFIL